MLPAHPGPAPAAAPKHMLFFALPCLSRPPAVVLAVNKCENAAKADLQAAEFWGTGLEPVPVSAISGSGGWGSLGLAWPGLLACLGLAVGAKGPAARVPLGWHSPLAWGGKSAGAHAAAALPWRQLPAASLAHGFQLSWFKLQAPAT